MKMSETTISKGGKTFCYAWNQPCGTAFCYSTDHVTAEFARLNIYFTSAELAKIRKRCR